MTEAEAHRILSNATAHHVRACGTQYRGCAPDCPKELAEQVLATASAARVASTRAAIATLSDEEWEQARPRMCRGCLRRLDLGERCYCEHDD